jgi:hypothetical protein
MSDFIPAWTALGVGIAQGDKERNEENTADAAQVDPGKDEDTVESDE